MTEQLWHDFQRDGFIGPFPRFLSDSALDELRRELEGIAVEHTRHPLYGRYSVRDWHLVSPAVLELFTHPVVVEPLSRLAGDDLTLWRSKLFYKPPGADQIGWHQEWGWFNGEEIGNDRPSLSPASLGEPWNLTVWFALDDITADNGPLQFVRGSHRTRYPIAMVPIAESAFYSDPFTGDPDTETLIKRARTNTLLLDIDTRHMFDGVDARGWTREQLKAHVLRWLNRLRAAVTLPFEAEPDSIVTLTMKRGQFVIFTERVMHSSLPNKSARGRVAINCRVTRSDTLVYPGRLWGEMIDGSNLDISRHRCVALCGRRLNKANVYVGDDGEQTGTPEDGIAAQRNESESAGPSKQHPLLGQRLPDLAHAPGCHYWECTLNTAATPFLRDHRVLGSVVVPGVTYIDMALAAAAEIWGPCPVTVEEVEYPHALALTDGVTRRVQLIYLSRPGQGEPSESAGVQVYSTLDGRTWQLHARLVLSITSGGGGAARALTGKGER
jgi:non-heme Fe2+,alpha-ketoglutarate-dependent halogenase